MGKHCDTENVSDTRLAIQTCVACQKLGVTLPVLGNSPLQEQLQPFVLAMERDEWYILPTQQFATRQTVHPRLQLHVKTDRKVYSIRDKIRLELEVRNVGTQRHLRSKVEFLFGFRGSRGTRNAGVKLVRARGSWRDI
jgi:hypothetical protein